MSLALSTIWDYARRAASPAPQSRTELYARAYEELHNIVKRPLTESERGTLHAAAHAEWNRLTNPKGAA